MSDELLLKATTLKSTPDDATPCMQTWLIYWILGHIPLFCV
jgi:hypothetical protein